MHDAEMGGFLGNLSLLAKGNEQPIQITQAINLLALEEHPSLSLLFTNIIGSLPMV